MYSLILSRDDKFCINSASYLSNPPILDVDSDIRVIASANNAALLLRRTLQYIISIATHPTRIFEQSALRKFIHTKEAFVCSEHSL